MQVRHRKAIQFALLAGVVALVLIDPAPNRNAKSPVSPASPQRHGQNDGSAVSPGAKGAAKALAPALPERSSLGEPAGDLFGSQSWQPPTSTVAAAPVKPIAPPMPYRFAGKLVQNGELQIFLSKGDTPIPIKPGEILDGIYRVESIGEDRVTLIYLPLGQRENVPVSSALPAATAAAPPFGAIPPTSGRQPGLGAIPLGAVVGSASTTPFRPRRDGAASTGTDGNVKSKPARLPREGPE